MGKKLTFISFLLVVTGFATAGYMFQKFERSLFYKAMASGTLANINSELSVVENTNNLEAYEGVLLMRKAGLVGKPKEKLRLFKEGRIKFQAAFTADSNNAELRFLRLGIQEHAPKIVKYHGDINKDKNYIVQHYTTLPPVVQQAIAEYSKTSKVLTPADF